MTRNPEDDFQAILVLDVIAASERRRKADNQSNRRDLIRTTFAAIEGVIWSFRQQVAEAAEETFGLDDDEVQALREVQYFVSEQGKVSSQTRHLSSIASFRLAARIAHRINNSEDVNFSDSEWGAFRDAIAVRNRVTHPKVLEDLNISDDDIMRSQDALEWLLEAQTKVLASTIQTRTRYKELFREVFEKLKTGDTEALAAYRDAQIRLANSD